MTLVNYALNLLSTFNLMSKNEPVLMFRFRFFS